MAKGILGTKIGMTQIFNETGKLVPVTVVQCEPNVVIQKKTVEKDGYNAVQLGFKNKRQSLVSKPMQGQFKKAQVQPKRYIKEMPGNELSLFEVGQEVNVNIFTKGEIVDVTGTSKGKGFQGVIKRHNQHRGPMSHGSHYHRLPGSMGSIDPNHVRPGKNLPGHMGAETVTMQNLEIVNVDAIKNLLLIKGNIPGPKRGLVIIKNAIKINKELAPVNPNDLIIEVQTAPETVEEPAVEVAPETVEEPAVEVAPEAVEEPAVEAAPEVVEEPAVEAAPEVVEEPVVEATPEAVEEPVKKEAAEVAVEPEEQKDEETSNDEATEKAAE
jgi:large subunit ribosomal protein L3